MIEYTLIKSKRRTMAITVKQDGSVIVRTPLRCSKKKAEKFVLENREWILRAQKKMEDRRAAGNDAKEGVQPFSKDEIAELRKQAKRVLPVMVAQLADIIGVSYGRISIRAQKTRWGSCSSKGNLNFNCLLILLPENVQRYVVVHELCHRKQMNHSAAFWNEVALYLPSYEEDKRQLRKLGRGLLDRLR